MTEWWAVILGLPRALRWALGAGAFVIAYFAGIEPALDLNKSLGIKADQYASALEKFRKASPERENQQAQVDQGVRRFGVVAPPEDAPKRTLAFNRLLGNLLKQQGITESTTVSRVASLPPGPLVTRLQAGGVPDGPATVVERLIVDVQLVATPEQISGLISSLERSPEVAAISRVLIRRSGEGRSMRANLAVETWILSPKERAR